MDALEAIHTRRSIREYEDRPVPDELVREIIAAAMSAPSAGNSRPWQFVAITDRDLLGRIPQIHPYAAMAARAPLAVLICGDLSLEQYPGNWIADCSAATQNLLLAAHAEGLGAVWTGVYPDQARVENFRKLLDLPEHIVPLALVPVGYPTHQPGRQDRYEEEKIHFDRW